MPEPEDSELFNRLIGVVRSGYKLVQNSGEFVRDMEPLLASIGDSIFSTVTGEPSTSAPTPTTAAPTRPSETEWEYWFVNMNDPGAAQELNQKTKEEGFKPSGESYGHLIILKRPKASDGPPDS